MILTPVGSGSYAFVMTAKLNGPDNSEKAEIDAAWDETIARRLDELMSGKVKPVSGRETFEIARTKPAQQAQEDAKDAALAVEIHTAVLNGDEPTIPLADVARELRGLP